jgi:hypothetical protein
MTALPFITQCPNTGLYVVTAEAVEFLSKIRGPLAVIAIAGKYRTGKSFLMNRVLFEGGGNFQVGSTVNACTKGIWILDQLVRCELVDGRVVFALVIDTEGIGSLEANSTHDCTIFTLALLLSSLFIYNSVGAIDDSALKTLSLVANISKRVRIATDKEPSTDDLAKIFPSFCWVLRDVTLRLETQEGQPMSANQYLENSLRDTGSGDDIDPVKHVLRTCFRERTCVTLVRPCQEEKDLQNLDANSPNSALRPVFLEQAKAAGVLFRSRARPKLYMDQEVSGSMLVTMARDFVKTINNGTVPVIKDSWQLIAEIQTKETIEMLLDTFAEKAREYRLRGPPMGREQCDAIVRSWTQKCLAKFADQALLKDQQGFKDQLVLRLERQSKETLHENDLALAKFLETRGQTLKEECLQADDWTSVCALFKSADASLADSLQLTPSVIGLWTLVKNEVLWPCLHDLALKIDVKLNLCRTREDEERVVIGRLNEQVNLLEKRKLELEIKLIDQEKMAKAEQEGAFQEAKRQKAAHSAELESASERAAALERRVLQTTQACQTRLLEVDTEHQVTLGALAEAQARLEAIGNENTRLEACVTELRAQAGNEESLRHSLQASEAQTCSMREQLASCEERWRHQEARFQVFVEECTNETTQAKNEFDAERARWSTMRAEFEERHAMLVCTASKDQQELQRKLSVAELEVQQGYGRYKDLEIEFVRAREEVQRFVALLEYERGLLTTCRQEQDELVTKHGQETKSLQDKMLDEHTQFCIRARDLESQLFASKNENQVVRRRLVEIEEEAGRSKGYQNEMLKSQAEANSHKATNEFLATDRATMNKRYDELRDKYSQLERTYREAQNEYKMAMLKAQLFRNSSNTQ